MSAGRRDRDGQERPRFYGRRVGKPLKSLRSSLLETLLPKFEIGLPKDRGARMDPRALFPFGPEQVWLEIGFGGGEHLAGQARAHPEVGILGCEVFVNGVASLLKHLNQGGQTNVRIYPEDVRLLMPFLPDASFDRIFVLFPDPWPKKRHTERRFIGPENLPGLSRLLKDDGELRVASDDPTYQRWTLQHVPVHPDFDWLVSGPEDWRDRPADWVPTRYEEKALEAGRTPMYFRFRRKRRM